jgi:hypothetical protein
VDRAAFFGSRIQDLGYEAEQLLTAEMTAWPRAQAASAAPWFAPDSPLEGTGLELSVPRRERDESLSGTTKSVSKRELIFRVPMGLDRQPQLIDQGSAVADFPTLFDIRQGVPQRQQPLTAEPAACSSSFDATTISPSVTATGGSWQRVIPSLPMM